MAIMHLLIMLGFSAAVKLSEKPCLSAAGDDDGTCMMDTTFSLAEAKATGLGTTTEFGEYESLVNATGLDTTAEFGEHERLVLQGVVLYQITPSDPCGPEPCGPDDTGLYKLTTGNFPGTIDKAQYPIVLLPVTISRLCWYLGGQIRGSHERNPHCVQTKSGGATVRGSGVYAGKLYAVKIGDGLFMYGANTELEAYGMTHWSGKVADYEVQSTDPCGKVKCGGIPNVVGWYTLKKWAPEEGNSTLFASMEIKGVVSIPALCDKLKGTLVAKECTNGADRKILFAQLENMQFVYGLEGQLEHNAVTHWGRRVPDPRRTAVSTATASAVTEKKCSDDFMDKRNKELLKQKMTGSFEDVLAKKDANVALLMIDFQVDFLHGKLGQPCPATQDRLTKNINDALNLCNGKPSCQVMTSLDFHPPKHVTFHGVHDNPDDNFVPTVPAERGHKEGTTGAGTDTKMLQFGEHTAYVEDPTHQVAIPKDNGALIPTGVRDEFITAFKKGGAVGFKGFFVDTDSKGAVAPPEIAVTGDKATFVPPPKGGGYKFTDKSVQNSAFYGQETGAFSIPKSRAPLSIGNLEQCAEQYAEPPQETIDPSCWPATTHVENTYVTPNAQGDDAVTLNFDKGDKKGEAFHENKIFEEATHVVVMGLVFDICVQHTALAAMKRKGKDVYILMPGTAQLKPDFLVWGCPDAGGQCQLPINEQLECNPETTIPQLPKGGCPGSDYATMAGAGVQFLTSV